MTQTYEKGTVDSQRKKLNKPVILPELPPTQKGIIWRQQAIEAMSDMINDGYSADRIRYIWLYQIAITETKFNELKRLAYDRVRLEAVLNNEETKH